MYGAMGGTIAFAISLPYFIINMLYGIVIM